MAGLPSRERVQVELRNIAPGGVLLKAAREIAEGTDIMIDMPALGWCSARVVWYFTEQHGCAFTTPLPQRYVDSLFDLYGD